MKIVTVKQMQDIEAAADSAGHSYAAMMEQAGQAVAQALIERVEIKEKKVLILVGPGNNGGDGLVAARYLTQAGAEVACYLTRPRKRRQDENLQQLHQLSVFFIATGDDSNWRTLQKLTRGADIIIDALLGTGTHLPVQGTVRQVLKKVKQILAKRAQATPRKLVHLNGLGEPIQPDCPLIVAVDGPSGLEFDTGELDEIALPADLTVTFAFPKIGHLSFPGANALGDLVVADIGINPTLAENVALQVMTADKVCSWLPPRLPDSHKGTFGRALIIAGSSNYTGAVRLAGAAAVRSGAGIVTLALPASIHSAVAAGLPETTYLLLPHELGVVTQSAAQVLSPKMDAYDAVLLGPGLGQEQETVAFVERLLGGARQRAVGFQRNDDAASSRPSLSPLIVDADGLNILAQLPDWPSQLPPGTVLTPHPGEMARLTERPVSEIQANRVEVARRKAKEWGHVVVLKGAFTVIAAPDGHTMIIPFANAALATGGTGDVLAGIIVALRAQGLEAFQAAAAAAYLHGLAGELARIKIGAPLIAAGDLVELLPKTWQKIANNTRR